MKNGLIVVALVVVLGLGYGWFQRHDGALVQQIKTLQAENSALTLQADSLREIAAKRDTLYIPIKAKVKPARVSTDSAIATLPPELLPPVKFAIDAERAACDLVVRTCEQRVADRDAMLDVQSAIAANLAHQLRLERQRRPGWFRRTVGKVAVFGAGMAAGRLLPH